jgi:Domain of unknown function (DUF4326)
MGMSLETNIRPPVRLQRSHIGLDGTLLADAVFVGQGSKWNNPLRKSDADALRGEPDVEAAFQRGGWREAVKLLYRDYLIEEGLNPHELRGKDLICTCKLGDPCHADVLLELANY